MRLTKWLLDGTGKTAKQKPPIIQKLGKRAQQPTVHQVQAAADRAAAVEGTETMKLVKLVVAEAQRAQTTRSLRLPWHGLKCGFGP